MIETLEFLNLVTSCYGALSLVACIAGVWLWRHVAKPAKVLIALACIMNLHAAYPTRADKEQGHRSAFVIDPYLRNAGSFATNDVVHLELRSAAIELPLQGSLVYLFAKDYYNPTNADGSVAWNQVGVGRAFYSAFSEDYSLANATNYDFSVWIDYTPPAPVHTNGVFNLYGFEMPAAMFSEAESLRAAFIQSAIKKEPANEE